MNVVDTSVLVSSLVRGDEFHLRSFAWLGARVVEHEQLTIPSLALPELAGVLARRGWGHAAAVASVRHVMENQRLRVIGVDTALAESAADVASACRLKGTDAVFVALARLLDVPLVTWDREMRDRGGAVADVRDPNDWGV